MNIEETKMRIVTDDIRKEVIAYTGKDKDLYYQINFLFNSNDFLTQNKKFIWAISQSYPEFKFIENIINFLSEDDRLSRNINVTRLHNIFRNSIKNLPVEDIAKILKSMIDVEYAVFEKEMLNLNNYDIYDNANKISVYYYNHLVIADEDVMINELAEDYPEATKNLFQKYLDDNKFNLLDYMWEEFKEDEAEPVSTETIYEVLQEF